MAWVQEMFGWMDGWDGMEGRMDTLCHKYNTDSDPTNKDLEAIQKCQNKLLRILNGTRISDKVSIKSILTKMKMLSVNQMNAQIKLNGMWKSVHVVNYLIKTLPLHRNEDV